MLCAAYQLLASNWQEVRKQKGNKDDKKETQRKKEDWLADQVQNVNMSCLSLFKESVVNDAVIVIGCFQICSTGSIIHCGL